MQVKYPGKNHQFFLALTPMLRYIFVLLVVLSVVSCRPEKEHYVPKPAGYFRVDTPLHHDYQVFDEKGFPYTFEYPVYGKIERDTVFFSEKADNPYWLNVTIPSLGGTINLTYKHIGANESFSKMVEDCYKLSFFHHEKATYMDEQNFRNTAGVTGVLYTVGGNAASRYQFTATDSVKNFMRGAIYFEVTPNADSLKPAYDFLYQDIMHIIATLKFR